MYYCVQEAVCTAVDLKKVGNELFRKENFLAASEKYKSALFWIAPLVKTSMPEVDKAQVTEAKREAVTILGNLSSALLKLDKPLVAITAATECINLNTDGSYFKVASPLAIFSD